MGYRLVAPPKPNEGEEPAPPVVLQSSDVFAAADGSWQQCRTPGEHLQREDQTLWVRPVDTA
jgi:hypothetical protein